MLSFDIIYFMLSFDVIIWCYDYFMLSFGVIIYVMLQYHLFYVIISPHFIIPENVTHSPTKLLYRPKQKPRRGGGLRNINTCRQVPLQVNE